MSEPAAPLVELPAHVADLLRDRNAAQINLYRALANSPEMVDTWLRFIWDLRDNCETPRSLREIGILRTAIRNGSDYEWAHHVRMARAAGVSEDQLAALKERGHSEVFSDEERLVLGLADAIVDGAVTDEVLRSALRTWGPARYVELVLTLSAYVMVPRVLDALRVPLEESVVETRLSR
jgi:alkylhydroperoxidase family enzyme